MLQQLMNFAIKLSSDFLQVSNIEYYTQILCPFYQSYQNGFHFACRKGNNSNKIKYKNEQFQNQIRNVHKGVQGPKNLIFSNFRGDPPLRSMPAQHFAKLRSMSQQSSKCRKSNKYCESTYICWHQLSQFLQNALILRFLNSWYQSITGNNQWENCILLDFYFRGLSGSQDQQKLEPHD